jgi:20S proteasome alpha/beta subunit
VTILVGIICKDGVVVASDSQAGSFKGVDVKRLDYTKIYDFSFGETKVAMTGAGEVPFIARAIELFEERAAEKHFHKAREIADLTEDVMNEINKRYVVQRMKDLGYQKSPGTPRAQLPAGDTLGFSLMLGVCCNNKPILYTVYPDGVAERGERYASLGSGSAFADYLLARLCTDDLSVDEAVRVAVYVIEEVKKVDLYCGGPTQVVAVTKHGIDRKDDNAIRKLVADLQRADKMSLGIWRLISKGKEALDATVKELQRQEAEKKPGDN